jgi:hypothetical protein
MQLCETKRSLCEPMCNLSMLISAAAPVHLTPRHVLESLARLLAHWSRRRQRQGVWLFLSPRRKSAIICEFARDQPLLFALAQVHR